MSKIINFFIGKVTKNLKPVDKKRAARLPRLQKRVINLMFKKNQITEREVNLHGILITFFGCGKIPLGPGTFASLATVIIWAGTIFATLKYTTITGLQECLMWTSLAIFLFFYGLLFVPLYSRRFTVHDHPSIVIDEVVGQILPLCLSYPFFREYYVEYWVSLHQLIIFAHISTCFILFRFFDISKPLFIGWVDKNIKNSFGVMIDDVICGLLTAIIIVITFVVYKFAIFHVGKSII